MKVYDIIIITVECQICILQLWSQNHILHYYKESVRLCIHERIMFSAKLWRKYTEQQHIEKATVLEQTHTRTHTSSHTAHAQKTLVLLFKTRTISTCVKMWVHHANFLWTVQKKPQFQKKTIVQVKLHYVISDKCLCAAGGCTSPRTPFF